MLNLNHVFIIALNKNTPFKIKILLKEMYKIGESNNFI